MTASRHWLFVECAAEIIYQATIVFVMSLIVTIRRVAAQPHGLLKETVLVFGSCRVSKG
jgi:hypothetical protein